MSISTSIGPISGINYGQLILGLTQLDQAPITQIGNQLQNLGQQNSAFQGLATELTALQVAGTSFQTGAVFGAATATSTNNNALTATAGIGTPVGNYTFNVDQLASSTQMVSQGLASASNPLGVSGNLVFEFGKGTLNPALNLSQLNGGNGVQAGMIRITDSTGATAQVDLTHAVTINDVVNAINSTTGVNVQAAIQGDRLVVTDKAGGTGTLAISNVGTGTTAADLGLTQAASGGVITGSDINTLSANTSLSDLNNGNGVRTAGLLNDFQINSSAGALSVSLRTANTLGDVINAINAAGMVGGHQVVTAAISATGHGLTITDSGGGSPTVTALNGSLAATDLGLTGTGSGGQLVGSRINAGLNSSLLTDLNGGSGVQLGQISITNRLGQTTAVNLAGANTVQDILNSINSAGAGVSAALNNAGTGIQITDTTNATSGSLSIANAGGDTTATQLGLVQTSATGAINGGDLHLRYISANTALSTLNGGAGIQQGQFQITDSTGKSFTVNVTATDQTIGNIINKINAGNIAVKASVNAQGNGILLTDTGGGQVKMSVQDLNGGTAAKSLNLAGTATGTTLNGSFEKTVAVSSTDSLQTIINNINAAGVGATASLVNDGSGGMPYRLSLVSGQSGASGALVFDGSAAGLNMTTLVQGQDAVVTYGNGGPGQNIQITSSNNTVNNVVPGLSVSLLAADAGPVSVSITQNTQQVTTSVQAMVTAYNAVIQNVAKLTAFNSASPTASGLLFGNSTVQQITDALGQFAGQIFTVGGSQNNSLASIGITINQDGTLAFNSGTLTSAMAANPTGVQALFTTKTTGVSDSLNTLINTFVGQGTGMIFQATNQIGSEEQQLTQQSAFLNTMLTDKKNSLMQQFANLEINLSNLQAQGAALNSYHSPTSSGSSSSSGGSSSSGTANVSSLGSSSSGSGYSGGSSGSSGSGSSGSGYSGSSSSGSGTPPGG